MRCKVFKFCELSWSALAQLKRWFNGSANRDGFTLSSLEPNLKVAEAVNSAGQVVLLCPIEQCFIVSGYVHNPDATSGELQQAGNAIDRELARLAAREGITRFLVTIPDGRPHEPGERWVRVVERRVPQTAMGATYPSQPTAIQYLN